MIENFGNKRNSNGFDKNPENINRRGANRKSFSAINEALKKKGIQPVTKNELIEFYTLIFNATEEELSKIVKDKKTPFALRIILIELNDKHTRSKAIGDLRNYMFGQAAQEIEHKITSIPDDELDARIAALEKKNSL